MPRSTKEWRGATDDTAVPDRVRLRIWRRQKEAVSPGSDHAVCPLSGLWLRDRDEKHLDHRVALIENGEHRESNLAYVHPIAHRKKTAAEVARRAENDANAIRHAGIKGRASPLAGPDRETKNAQRDARSKAIGAKAPAARPDDGLRLGCFKIRETVNG